jgi:hypothetical protein
LFDVAVGHPGYVIGDGAGETFSGDLNLMIAGEQAGILHEGGKDLVYDAGRASVFLFHAGRVVEAGVEIELGCGAFSFHFRTQGGETGWCMADVVEGDCRDIGYAAMDFFDEVCNESIEDAVEGLVDGLLGGGIGVFAGDLVVKLTEEWDVVADLIDFEDAGVESVVEVGGEVSDFVSDIDELRFERRAKVEEVVGEFGMRGRGVVA